MEKKDFVFVLGNYHCDKNCPYCIAKMSNKKTASFEEEIEKLQNKLQDYAEKGVHFEYFILSGNGEPSLYSKEELRRIKEIVEESNIFTDYRIQTSGNLFMEKEKLELFVSWLKEITVISSNSKEDQTFYRYKKSYLDSKAFQNTSRIRVNIVLLKNNLENINQLIKDYSIKNNVETIALKILDRKDNNSKESTWVKENAISYDQIDKIVELISQENVFLTFKSKRFYFETKDSKKITINYDPTNHYDDINLEENFCWHERKIKKGTYGEISKIEEELEEAKDALEQGNRLMFLIELSDILGAVEGISEKYGLAISDLKAFSNKVKESKLHGKISS